MTATPYLCAKDAASAIEFYEEAFGATETTRMTDTSGKVGHAEFKIGDADFMISDEWPEGGVLSPQSLGGTPVAIYLQVDDVDALAKQAVAAGASLVRPVEDQFHGNRTGVLVDPFGHRWMISTHIEDVAPEEMRKRAAALGYE
jgi:PhnB protein